jgi:hypothetical protein
VPNVALLSLRLGQKTAEPLSSEFDILYARVASWFVNSPTIIPNGQRHATIPVATETDFANAAPVITSYLIDANAELAIVDLANSARPVLAPYSVVSGIIRSREQASASIGHDVRLVFLLPAELWDEDPPMELIRPLIDGRKAWILTDSGSLIGQHPLVGEIPTSVEYVQLLEKARAGPLVLLRQKLIRWHGHYRRTRRASGPECVSYFFDGTFCTNELTHLLAGRLSQGIATGEILVEYGESDWMLDAIDAATNQLDLDYRVLSPWKGQLHQALDVPDKPFLIVGMCDKGDTLAQILRQLKARNPKIDPRIISILSTDGKAEEDGDRLISVDNDQYIVEYFLKVRQQHIPSAECRQCRVRIPYSAAQHEEIAAAEIPVRAMWSMIFEAGLKPEADVPKERPSLGLVPDFPGVVAMNGPYLAYKMHALLDQIPGKLPRDPIIVCPDEAGADALADALTNIFKFTIIRIPRDEISRFNGTIPASTPTDSWLLQLKSLKERADRTKVIILDEFNASGGTRQKLGEMMKSFGLELLCYFSLFDFAPKARDGLDARAISMYSLNWLGPA